MQTLLRPAVVLAFLAAGAAQAGTITVTSVGTTSAPNTWYQSFIRNDSGLTTAGISGANPRSGNASVEMTMSVSNGKADYAYNWGFVNGRTLGNLNSLGYDWFRAGGSSPAHFHPAIRLVYDKDGSESTPDDRGYLIYEQVYNGGANTQGSWVSSDILGANFWQRQFSPGNTVTDYDITLAEWAAGEIADTRSSVIKDFDQLSASTAILGMEFGIGSGWQGSFQGNVDNVRFGFRGEDSITFNFELASANVPEPASMALLGLGAFGIAAARRRRQK